jgi:AcrR family transcriptional regulator
MSMSESVSAPALGPKRARTRDRLIEAAATLFAQHGLSRTTLAQVANHAEMTTGAIYGNFRNKEELILAVFERFTFGVNDELEDGAGLAGADFQEQMRRIGEAVVAFLPKAEASGVLFHEFHIYAAIHPRFRAETERRTQAKYEAVAERWRCFLRESDTRMPMERFVAIVDALIDGLICQRRLTPQVLTDDVIREAFTAFGR